MAKARTTYTVKEVLARVERQQLEGFARIEAVQAGKADKSDIERLEKTVETHSGRISDLETRQGRDDAAVAATAQMKRTRRDFKQWAIPVLVSIALVVVSVVH